LPLRRFTMHLENASPAFVLVASICKSLDHRDMRGKVKRGSTNG
jgi:hypothetical protein